MANYNGSQVGVPYVRAHRIVISWPDATAKPFAVIEQSLGVKLADGSVRKLENLADITVELDFTQGDAPIPLVSPDDASPLGMDTTLNQAMVAVLAVVRKYQIAAE
jgi:hypothetical protein